MATDTNDTSASAPASAPAAAAASPATPLPAAPSPVPAVTPAVAVVTSFPVTLQEFCTRLSTIDKRVELIGAFHYTETAAGTVKDAEEAFKARFADFLNKPV